MASTCTTPVEEAGREAPLGRFRAPGPRPAGQRLCARERGTEVTPACRAAGQRLLVSDCRPDEGTLRRGRSGQGRRRSREGEGGSGPRRPPATQDGEDDLGFGAEGESGAAVRGGARGRAMQGGAHGDRWRRRGPPRLLARASGVGEGGDWTGRREQAAEPKIGRGEGASGGTTPIGGTTGFRG